jgi:nucleotide-binding universal stress UspA family protein
MATRKKRPGQFLRRPSDQSRFPGHNINLTGMHKYRILVPVSFRPQSDAALKYARRIAQQRKGMITCLYVVEKPGFITGRFITRELEMQIRRDAELHLSSTVNRIFKSDKTVAFELIVTSGKVHHKILEKASELKTDLIVMGRSDSVDLTKNYLGSNASHVMARATMPVLSIRSSKNILANHILFPLDLSNPVTIKIAKAIEIAQLQKTRFSVCTILDPGRISLESAYRERLKEIKKLISDHEIECTVHLKITGELISEAILSLAGELRSEQILIMTQKEPDITELFIGSTAREVLKKSEIPVLSFTPGVQTKQFPFKSLFGNINHPITLDGKNEQLINH